MGRKPEEQGCWWILKCLMGFVMLREPGDRNVLWYANRHHLRHLSFLSQIRKKALFLVNNQFHEFLRDASFYLTSRIWGNGVSFEPENLHRTWPCYLYHVTLDYETIIAKDKVRVRSVSI